MIQSPVIGGLLLALLAISGCSAGKSPSGSDNSFKHHYDVVKVFAGLYYQNVYDKINERLVKMIEDTHAGANLASAKNWLAEEKKKKSLISGPTIPALEQFVALDRLSGDIKCDRESYSILYKNNKATSDHARRAPSQVGPLRRIENIIYKYNRKHALECSRVYPTKYAELLQTIDKEGLDKVEKFIDGCVKQTTSGGWFKKTKSVDPLEVAMDMKFMYGKEAGQAAYNALYEFTVADPDRIYLAKTVNELNGKLEVNTGKVGSLVDRYLVQPCLAYVTTLGPDLFIPANYDWPILEPDARIDMETAEGREFYRGWVRFRLCRRLVDKDRDALVKRVVSLANKAK